VTGTGTGVGKTAIATALARALSARGVAAAAMKPIETGVDAIAEDAAALAAACGRPELADDPRWFRARAAISPYAATRRGEPAVDLRGLAAAVRAHAEGRVAIVEGAGGLFVPLTRTETIADLAAELGLPLLVVAPNRLGVLSDVLSLLAATRLPIASLALVDCVAQLDASGHDNAEILSERLGIPVFRVRYIPDLEARAEELARLGIADRT
jgi:dethiobiotin synthetase